MTKLALLAKCGDTLVITRLAHKAASTKLCGSDVFFVVRSALLLIEDPRQCDIIDSIEPLMDGECDNEEELIWIIVFMHNTALDLMVMQDYKSAKRWSEASLRLCSNLSPRNQETYEKAVRGAFLSIIQAI